MAEPRFFRVRAKRLGGHVHTTWRAARRVDGSYAGIGQLVVDLDDWAALAPILDASPLINIVADPVPEDDPVPGRPQPTLVELLVEAGRRGIPVSMLPEAIASAAMARDGEGTYSVEADDLDDTTCCALDEGHPGPCEWDCSDCAGTGLCIECDGGCECDDVVRCEWCDGDHVCPHCDEGRWIDE